MSTKRISKKDQRQTVAPKATKRSMDYRSVYVNHVQFGLTRFDVQVSIGLVEISNAEEYKDIVQEQLSLKMTPAYAKAFVTDMTNFLAQYEAVYGEIQMPLPLDQPKVG